MNIIIYGSNYGNAGKYAEELAKRSGYEYIPYKEVKDINSYETIVYIGSLYASGVLGMDKTFKKLTDISSKKIIVATVGIADPTEKANSDSIKRGIQKRISKELYEKASIFHLRGGIDYSQLNFMHKTMMGMLYKRCVNWPEEKKTSEVRAMIDTYNKKVDFIDFDSLAPIIQELKK